MWVIFISCVLMSFVMLARFFINKQNVRLYIYHAVFINRYNNS